ncbi:hypothetical protein D918_01559 [Trichuris suis]|nr:hypothetical protein D918_01559 [Trichuris suis]
MATREEFTLCASRRLETKTRSLSVRIGQTVAQMAYRDGYEHHETKVYVGGLPDRASRSEIEAVFSRFGQLRNVWVARRPSGFAFVVFEDGRDAEDAVRSLDGTKLCGVKVRVEISHGRRRDRGRFEDGYRSDRRRTPPRRSRSSSYRRSRSPPPPPRRRSRSRS